MAKRSDEGWHVEQDVKIRRLKKDDGSWVVLLVLALIVMGLLADTC